MKITYTFDTADLDQKAELFRVQQADNFYFALLDLQRDLHDAAKYQSDTGAQFWQERLVCILSNRNVDLGD